MSHPPEAPGTPDDPCRACGAVLASDDDPCPGCGTHRDPLDDPCTVCGVARGPWLGEIAYWHGRALVAQDDLDLLTAALRTARIVTIGAHVELAVRNRNRAGSAQVPSS
jgi:hypothetical protein